MGNSTSKAARNASGATKRQYPSRVPSQPGLGLGLGHKPQAPPASAAAGPTVHPPTQASTSRDEVVNADAYDPQLNASLRSLGPVTPSPTYSNSSTAQPSPDLGGQLSGSQPIFPSPGNNPALQVLQARHKLAEEAEAEFADYGKSAFQGRRFLDVMIIRQMLRMRDEQGKTNDQIERELGLQRGVAAKLGKKGIFADIGARSVGEGALD